MFAIPAHNATVERAFSLMESQWTDKRNRMLVETIKNLVFVKFNIRNKSCLEFYEEVTRNKELLDQVGKSDKYDFINKNTV